MIAKLHNLIADWARTQQVELPESVQVTEAPAHASGAHYSTNAALLLAQPLQQPPQTVASQLAEALRHSPDIEKVDIAGPGFLNLTITDAAYSEELQAMTAISLGQALKLPAAECLKIDVEYVSANPSGPLHIGNARGGPIGEAIVRILLARGHQVTRDFYVNDIGGQANRFAESVLHYYAKQLGESWPFPEDGYQGQYVQELADSIVQSNHRQIWEAPDKVEAMRVEAISRMVDGIKKVTDQMGIQFDCWYWQHQLHQDGLVKRALQILQEHDATLEKDGAIWLKAGFRDDDRETVLVKSDGSTGYFLDDLAYHLGKFTDRGFDLAVCLLGADHSGHPPRMRAGIQALGFRADQYQAVVYQYVQLKENGVAVGMSKRAGNIMLAEQVLAEVPRDVFTYFMVSKANETHVDFDLQLAKDTSEKNPVYSIQYAHARICSLLGKVGERPEVKLADYNWAPAEQALLRHLAAFPGIVIEVSQTYRVNLLTQFLFELAGRYHQFYAQHRIAQAESDQAKLVRLQLSEQTQKSLQLGLELLNISAPTSLSRA